MRHCDLLILDIVDNVCGVQKGVAQDELEIDAWLDVEDTGGGVVGELRTVGEGYCRRDEVRYWNFDFHTLGAPKIEGEDGGCGGYVTGNDCRAKFFDVARA